MMAQLTVRQASEYAKQRGQSLSISYLNRLAKKDSARLKAAFVDLPTGIGYWLIDEDALNAYLASDRKRGGYHGRKPKGEGSADA
jgi:hypothetical protein